MINRQPVAHTQHSHRRIHSIASRPYRACPDPPTRAFPERPRAARTILFTRNNSSWHADSLVWNADPSVWHAEHQSGMAIPLWHEQQDADATNRAPRTKSIRPKHHQHLFSVVFLMFDNLWSHVSVRARFLIRPRIRKIRSRR